MKPKNFPGRKNQRRKVALITTAKRDDKEALVELATLHGRVVAPDVARAIRTKKDRSARAKFRAA